jgi:signal transduction histidine kinase
MFEDERKSTAALIAADPAFTSLEVSGAPILAVMGTPPRVVYANAAAMAVFGADPAARLLTGEHGLAAALDRLRGSAAPRLERLSIDLGSGVQTITILCRRLFESDDAPCFVVAALGLRADSAPEAVAQEPAPQEPEPQEPEPQAPKAESEPPEAKVQADERLDMSREALRTLLAERHGDAAPRFLWKTDAAGRFVDVTHALGDVVGAKYADLLGRGVEEASEAMGLGPAFAAALATRKSWSGVAVDWPLEEPAARVPTTLGGLPIYDAQRGFLGFQGFGVLRLSLAEPDVSALAPNAEEEEAEIEPQTPPPPEPEFSGANVVALRPPAHEPPAELSPVEQIAFDEIARTLVGGPEPGGARDLLDQVSRAIEQPPVADDDASRATAMLEILPVGVLVARGAKALYANRTLLDYLGYADLDALAADGGLAQVFLGGLPGRAPATTPVELQAQDGETLDVDAHVQTIDWSGGPATLISLRRVRKNAQTRIDHARLCAKEAEFARVKAELARFKEEHEALAACFDSAAQPTAIVTGAGQIERVNTKFAALLGEDARLAAGRDLSTFFGDEDAMLLKALFGNGKTETAAETILAVKSRRAGLPKTKLSLRRLSAGRFVARAIAEPAPARSESDAAREEAERASAAKSDFLARVSHEIRTPLNAIIGFAEVMMEERFGPIGCERYKEYLKDVHTSGAHVLSLVNDLLDLSKIEAGKMELVPEEIDVNAIIGESVSIMQTQANQQRVIVRLSLAPRLPRIRADERSLRQILLNLLSNAVKFNEPGGQVIVSSALTDAGFVVIRVKDTGIGMSDDEIDIALEPFRQVSTARKTSGTGLGLPVTKALIEANHASFMIKSRKNEGTLIEVAFPPARSLAAE